jgi:hypothetical protein
MIEIIRKPKKININDVGELKYGDMFELINANKEVFICLEDYGLEYINCYNIKTNTLQKIDRRKKCYKIFNIKLEYEIEIIS